MSLITLPGDAGHILRNRCESRLEANWLEARHGEQEARSPGSFKTGTGVPQGWGLPKGVLVAPPVYLRGFSYVLELWRSGAQETLFRMCPDALVPAAFREGKLPCHYIPLNEQSETIQSLYRWGTPEELEAAVSEWLMNTIQKLELERTQRQSDLRPRGRPWARPRRTFGASKAMSFSVFQSGLLESFRLSPGTVVSFSQQSAGQLKRLRLSRLLRKAFLALRRVLPNSRA